MTLRTTVRSPRSGEVLAISVKAGDAVGAGEVLCRVAEVAFSPPS